MKNSKSQQPLTFWRAKNRHCHQAWDTPSHSSYSQTGEWRTSIVSRLKTQQATVATHFLEIQEQALSEGLKHSKPQQPLTAWRAKDRHYQQVWNLASHNSYSHPREPRSGIASRLKIQQSTAATHTLKSEGQSLSTGLKHSKAQWPLTDWRVKNRNCQ